MAKRRPRPVQRDRPVAAPEAPAEAVPAPARQSAPSGFKLIPAFSLGKWDRGRALIGGLALAFAIYYYWTAAPCSTLFGILQGECSPNRIMGTNGKPIGPYNVMAESLLARRTMLLIKPDPRLLQLPDPYDPGQNFYFRHHAMHDMSLYKGRFYSYFGPAPALLLFAPFRFVTGTYLPDAIGCAVLALGAFLFASLALRLILKSFFPTLPLWVFPVLSFTLGFCNTYPFLLRRPAMYEIAIAGGQCFLMAAVYFLSRAVLGAGGHPLRDAALAGAAAALAVASRPQLLLCDAVLLLLILVAPPAFDRQRRKVLVSAMAPFVGGGLLIAWYNYMRFDSIFEFGQHYQLAGVNMAKISSLELSRIPASLYFYLFCPIGLSSKFPFLQTTTHAPFTLPASIVGLERITGIVWLSPLLLILFLFPLMWKRRQTESGRPAIWVLALLGAAWIVLFVDSSTGSPTMRYQADSSSLFFLAAGITLGWVLVSCPPHLRRYATAGLFVLAASGIICNAALGISGVYDNFLRAAPEPFRAMESLFQPVAKLLGALGL
jgi:hypothetical protein